MRCLCEGSAAYESGNSGPSGYGMSGPGGLVGRTCTFDGCVGVGDGDVGTACAMPIPSPIALKPRPPDTTAMATSCLCFKPRISWPGRMLIALTYWGGADFRTQKLPTNLAHLSVKGARPLAIAQVVSVHGVIAVGSVHGVIAQESVDASLVGSGIGDADTGIVGVCLSWWNAEGCQCYDRCRRHAHHCPLNHLFLS